MEGGIKDSSEDEGTAFGILDLFCLRSGKNGHDCYAGISEWRVLEGSEGCQGVRRKVWAPSEGFEMACLGKMFCLHLLLQLSSSHF